MIRVKKHDGKTVVRCSGEMDFNSAERLEKILSEFVEQREEMIVLDMEEVTFLSTSVIGVILGTAGEIRRHGGELVISAANDYVRDSLNLIGADRFIAMVPSLQEALQSSLQHIRRMLRLR